MSEPADLTCLCRTCGQYCENELCVDKCPDCRNAGRDPVYECRAYWPTITCQRCKNTEITPADNYCRICGLKLDNPRVRVIHHGKPEHHALFNKLTKSMLEED